MMTFRISHEIARLQRHPSFGHLALFHAHSSPYPELQLLKEVKTVGIDGCCGLQSDILPIAKSTWPIKGDVYIQYNNKQHECNFTI